MSAICPKCGAENDTGAKFCHECGAPFAKSQTDASIKSEIAAGTQLDFKTWSLKKKGAVAGVFAAIAVIAIVLVAGAGGGPSDADIEAIIRAHMNPGRFSSAYVTHTDYEIDSIKVTAKEKQSLTAEEKQLLAAFGADLDTNSYYECQFEADLSCEIADNVKTGSLAVIKYQGSWELIGSLSIDSSTVTAKAGVDADKVIEGMQSILYAVGSQDGNDYMSLYQNGSFEVTDENFDADAQTDTLTVSCTKQGGYSNTEGTMTLVFAFKDGSWSLSSATASEDAAKTSYQTLVGTWTGAFYRQSSPSSGKCYGAEDADVKVEITSVDDDSLKVEGKYTVIAHNHDNASSDEDSNAGDTVLAEEEFTLTLEQDTYITNFGSFEYGGTYTRPEDANGQVRLYLGFGPYQGDTGTSAVLMVETQYSGIMYSWNYYKDIFTLEKAA